MGQGPTEVGVSDPGIGGGGTNDNGQFLWFDPLELLAAVLGTQDPTFIYWCQACGGENLASLVNITDLAEGESPTFACFTLDNVANLGLCEIFREWMYSYWWAIHAGGAELACGEFHV